MRPKSREETPQRGGADLLAWVLRRKDLSWAFMSAVQMEWPTALPDRRNLNRFLTLLQARTSTRRGLPRSLEMAMDWAGQDGISQRLFGLLVSDHQ